MNTFQILSLLGIGSIAISIWGFLFKNAKKTALAIKAMKLGLQAVLRAQMINDYNHYTVKGFAPIYAKDNFQNCWNQYENLGANGVMNDIYKKFMLLPDRPQEGEIQNG